MKRTDFEIVAFSVSLGLACVFAQLRDHTVALGDALISGGLLASATSAMLYGVTLAGRGAPAAAAIRAEMIAPVRLHYAAPIKDTTPADDTREARWRTAMRQFLLAGRLCGGMSLRTIVGAGVLSDTGYRSAVAALKHNGMITTGREGTDYAPAWDYGRCVYWLKHEPVDTPDKEPPVFRWTR